MPVILFVDDDPDIRDLVEISLSDAADLALVSCASAAEALARLAEVSPDLILLDVNLSDSSGVELMSKIEEVTGRCSPTIFITADTAAKDQEKLLTTGAKGVIAKPFDALGLAEKLRSFLTD